MSASAFHSTYHDITEQSMIWQASPPDNSFMPVNWTASLGNDDQGFWGMSAMLAAEVNYPNPPDKDPQLVACSSPSRIQHTSTCAGGRFLWRWSTMADPSYQQGIEGRNLPYSRDCSLNV